MSFQQSVHSSSSSLSTALALPAVLLVSLLSAGLSLPVLACLPLLSWGQQFVCVLPSLMGPRRGFDSSVCSAFYLSWSSDVPAVYMQNQQPEVLPQFAVRPLLFWNAASPVAACRIPDSSPFKAEFITTLLRKHVPVFTIGNMCLCHVPGAFS